MIFVSENNSQLRNRGRVVFQLLQHGTDPIISHHIHEWLIPRDIGHAYVYPFNHEVHIKFVHLSANDPKKEKKPLRRRSNPAGREHLEGNK